MKYLIIILLSIAFIANSCDKEENLFVTDAEHHFYLRNDGANMPITVEGNTASKTFILIIHGGPGGEATVYNRLYSGFSNPLETDYGMIYWDQRASGSATGKFDESLMTVEQYVEDLDKLVDLIKQRYGQDISLFLMGHSWGGLLGNAYLIEDGTQDKINGWIEVDGAHNFELLNKVAIDSLINIGRDQISLGNSTEEWQDIIDFAIDLDTNNLSDEDISLINQNAGSGEELLNTDEVVNSYDGETNLINYLFFSEYNIGLSISNVFTTSNRLFSDIARISLSEEMSKITIPCQFMWGKYDLRVPTALAYDGYESVSTPEENKYLFIFENSEHSPMISETDLFIQHTKAFVEMYK